MHCFCVVGKYSIYNMLVCVFIAFLLLHWFDVCVCIRTFAFLIAQISICNYWGSWSVIFSSNKHHQRWRSRCGGGAQGSSHILRSVQHNKIEFAIQFVFYSFCALRFFFCEYERYFFYTIRTSEEKKRPLNWDVLCEHIYFFCSFRRVSVRT